jgi:hypothetical protein
VPRWAGCWRVRVLAGERAFVNRAYLLLRME